MDRWFTSHARIAARPFLRTPSSQAIRELSAPAQSDQFIATGPCPGPSWLLKLSIRVGEQARYSGRGARWSREVHFVASTNRLRKEILMTRAICVGRRGATAIVALAPILLSACIAVGPKMPSAMANFVPQQTYPLSFDGAWSRVISSLSQHGIPIASSSKETGQIATDYIPGSTTVGFMNTSSRYKYTLFLFRSGGSSTTINISVTLESGSVDGGFHDVSAFNTVLVAGLRNALYQKLEPSLHSP